MIGKNNICLILEQKLEETCEHLQIVTDSEGLLRSRCACLEEKQKEDKDRIEVTPHCLIQIMVKRKTKQSVVAIIFCHDHVLCRDIRQQRFM